MQTRRPDGLLGGVVSSPAKRKTGAAGGGGRREGGKVEWQRQPSGPWQCCRRDGAIQEQGSICCKCRVSGRVRTAFSLQLCRAECQTGPTPFRTTEGLLVDVWMWRGGLADGKTAANNMCSAPRKIGSAYDAAVYLRSTYPQLSTPEWTPCRVGRRSFHAANHGMFREGSWIEHWDRLGRRSEFCWSCSRFHPSLDTSRDAV